jgi:hypothetical protein
MDLAREACGCTRVKSGLQAEFLNRIFIGSHSLPLSSSSLRSLTSHGLEVGRSHLEGWPHLPTAIPAQTDASNRPSTASGARIRSIQVKRQWIIGPATPLGPAAPMKMGPHAQPTSLTYKRSLTLAVSNTQRRSISLPLFCSLRVGLV